MNQILQTLQPPNPPTPTQDPTTEKPFGAMQRQLKKLTTHATDFANWTTLRLGEIRTQVNTQVQGWGPALASAATITPTAAHHHVTGTAAIATITVPAGFSGNIWLIPDGLWTMVTGGNIAHAVTAVVDRQLAMDWDPTAMLWFPAYFS
jgi:hypothetical protein